MPDQFMRLVPAEYEVMLDSKLKLLRVQYPHLAPKKDETHDQTTEEQFTMINAANKLFGGSTV